MHTTSVLKTLFCAFREDANISAPTYKNPSYSLNRHPEPVWDDHLTRWCIDLREALSGTGDRSHLGILAVDTRLRHLFGAEYGLTISTGSNAGTKVTVRLPKYAP